MHKKYKYKKGKWKIKNVIVSIYNKTESGIDLVGCYAEIYKFQRKSYKWWKSVFFI